LEWVKRGEKGGRAAYNQKNNGGSKENTPAYLQFSSQLKGGSKAKQVPQRKRRKGEGTDKKRDPKLQRIRWTQQDEVST